MTNKEIIFNESTKLMNEGKISDTGRVFTVKFDDGTVKEFVEPEAIHTFATWKQLGYNVKKGEKAIAKFPIWKYTSKTVVNEETNEEEHSSNCFMKMSAFFKISQVEKVGENV